MGTKDGKAAFTVSVRNIIVGGRNARVTRTEKLHLPRCLEHILLDREN